MYLESIIISVILSSCCWCSRLPLEVFQQNPREHYMHHHKLNYIGGSFHRNKKLSTELNSVRILYQIGTTDLDLPECGPRAVCSKVDLYDVPWVEKQCRCPGQRHCSASLQPEDGFTLADKTRLYKLCEPVKRIAKCRFFRDVTWTITLFASNVTEQTVHCHCPRSATTYLTKRQALHPKGDQTAFQYSFACAPQTRLRCQRKEPCRLFTVRKRQELLDEVNVSSLCQCPRAHRCPHHHTDYGVIAGKSYTEEAIKTYSGYCLPS